VDTAAWTIGHLPGRSDNQFWFGAMRQHCRRRRRSSSAVSVSALRGLVYGLGISRQHAVLTSLRADTSPPPAVRTATRWWLAIPKHISASTAR
jgi:hypothetical protein